MYLFTVSIFTTLDIYKTYFKSRHIQIQIPKDYFFLCEKLLHLYVLEFCNQMLPDLHY